MTLRLKLCFKQQFYFSLHEAYTMRLVSTTGHPTNSTTGHPTKKCLYPSLIRSVASK